MSTKKNKLTIHVKPLLDLCLFYLADNPQHFLPFIPQDLYPKLYVAINESEYWKKLTRCQIIVKNVFGTHICNRKKPCYYHDNEPISDGYRCKAINSSNGERCKSHRYRGDFCMIHSMQNKQDVIMLLKLVWQHIIISILSHIVKNMIKNLIIIVDVRLY